MVQTVLCIPGVWSSREALVGALLERHGGRLMVMGSSIVDSTTGLTVEFQTEPKISTLENSFRAAAIYSEMDETDFSALGTHRLCVFLTHQHTGTLTDAARMLVMGQVFLECGGLAVKVESSGKAHSESEWMSYDPLDAEDLFWAYVVLAGTPNCWYSCGMHNLGKPDVSLSGVGDSEQAARLVDSLTRYLLLDEPDLKPGETFGMGPEEPAYKLDTRPCEAFSAEDAYHNPFGLWHMEPV